MREAWEWYEGKAPLELPKDDKPVPPQPYQQGDEHLSPVVIVPIDVKPIKIEPQPKPVEPIREVPVPDANYVTVDFYGVPCKVRMPNEMPINLGSCSNNAIADSWQRLGGKDMDNTIHDCLETRMRLGLCDWAYLEFLDALSRKYCENGNSATLMMAYLYCQSGYQMRLAADNSRLVMLYGSKHRIYNKVYYELWGNNFYPYGEPVNSIRICDMAFEGETPMSLYINSEQRFGVEMSDGRTIRALS